MTPSFPHTLYLSHRQTLLALPSRCFQSEAMLAAWLGHHPFSPGLQVASRPLSCFRPPNFSTEGRLILSKGNSGHVTSLLKTPLMDSYFSQSKTQHLSIFPLRLTYLHLPPSPCSSHTSPSLVPEPLGAKQCLFYVPGTLPQHPQSSAPYLATQASPF